MIGSRDDQKQSFGLSVWTRFVLGGVAVLCVVLIASIGLFKYKMDSVQSVLAAPDSAFSAQDESVNRMAVALGYGGFLGAAQTYILKHDASALGDMKLQIKAAQDAAAALGDKAPASIRHDIDSILSLYAAVMERVDSGKESPSLLTMADLAPLTATLPVLDNRLQAIASLKRAEAQQQLSGYNMGLVMIAWTCLVGMAGLAVALFLALRNRTARPLQALTQSIRAIAKGDMSTPVWGMERTDAIGDLARAMDLARYHFAQIPDLSVMSDQGPVRLRFEGDTKSLFHAMMKEMATDYQATMAKAHDMSTAISKEQDVLTALSVRMNTILSEVQLNSTESMGSIRQFIRSLSDSSNVLADAHEKLAVRVNKLIPFMQERAKNMAEVTSIIGTHAGATLQKLAQAEAGLRNSAAQSEKTIADFAKATTDMSERLFAALNLMQVSSKVLTETTETTQSRFNEAVDTLGRGETSLQEVLARAEARLKNTVNAEENLAALAMRTESSAEKMEIAVYDLMRRNDALNDQVTETSDRLASMLQHFETAQRTMGDTVGSIRRDSSALNTMVQDIRSNNDQLLSSIHQNSQTSFTSIQSMTERAQALMQRLDVQIVQQSQVVESRLEDLSSHGGVMAQQVAATTASLAQTVSALKIEQDKFVATRGKFTDTITDMGTRLEQQAQATLSRTEYVAAQSYEKLAALSGQMDTVLQRLSIMGQLTGTLGAVAGQLGQLVPVLTASAPALTAGGAGANGGDSLDLKPDMTAFARDLLDQMRDTMRNEWHNVLTQIDALTSDHVLKARDVLAQKLEEQKGRMLDALDHLDVTGATLPDDQMQELLAALKKPWEDVLDRLEDLAVPFIPKVDTAQISKTLQLDMQTQWHRAIVQIEAMNDQLAQMMLSQKDQLETRLMVMDKKLKDLASLSDTLAQTPSVTPPPPSSDVPAADLLKDLLCSLADVTDHMTEIDASLETLNEAVFDPRKQAEG